MPISTERPSVVVADAGPLIALGRLNRLDLLPRLFADIQVTATVLDECLAHPKLPDAQRIADALAAGHIHRCADAAFVVVDRQGVRVRPVLTHIPPGGVACIMLEPGTRVSHMAAAPTNCWHRNLCVKWKGRTQPGQLSRRIYLFPE